MFLFLCIAYLCGFLFFLFSSVFSDLSLDLHQACLSQAPHSPFHVLYTSLVCGARVPKGPLWQNITPTGMAHLFVVSGAHLHFLDQFLKVCIPSKIYRKIQLPLLFLFVCCCSMKLPALRAWFYFLLCRWNQTKKLYIPRLQILMASIVFCLGFSPSHLHSYSLLLSWFASLGIICGRNTFTQAAFVYIFTWPLIPGLSPWTVTLNSFLAPLLGSVIFPLSLMSFAISPLTKLVDGIWVGYFSLTQILSPYLKTQNPNFLQWNFLHFWLLGLGLHLTIALLQTQHRSYR